MQQYFLEQPVSVGDVIELPSDKAHHAIRVLKLNHETVRLVYQNTGYFADVYPEGKKGMARILEQDAAFNELKTDITLCMALIRREKFELVLQKAAELGVRRIVPFESSRCVVHARQEKLERQKERWNVILSEASEQCKRNLIPECTDVVSFSSLPDYKRAVNVCAYEKATGKAQRLSSFENPESITVVIGPEGGFSSAEVEFLEQADFTSITLGNRILRAETAAMYVCAAIGELFQ